MEKERFYPSFAARFETATNEQLVNTLNKSVGNCGWSSMRARHDSALVSELHRRGIDISAIHHDGVTSFAHHVALDSGQSRLNITEQA